MNKTAKAEILFLKKKERSIRNLIAYLLELIQETQKEVMIQTMKLVKYKYLSVNLKKKKRKENENKIKELGDEIKKLKLQLTNQSV